MKRLTRLLGAVAFLACGAGVNAQAPAGPVALTVTLPDPGQKLLYVEESMPVKPGPLTLYYPKWIPGDHSPDGEIEKVLGIEFTAGGRRLPVARGGTDRISVILPL